MAGIAFRELRRRVKIGAVLELLEFEAGERRGEQVRGPCPLHGSRSPRSRSFAAHLGKGVYHCFVCGAGGKALDLWVARTGLPLYQAALDLCERLHLEAPWQPFCR
jgi:DNA primase